MDGVTFKNRVIGVINNEVPDDDDITGNNIVAGSADVRISYNKDLNNHFVKKQIVIEWEEIENQHPCHGCDYFEAGCPNLDEILDRKDN